jgi:predicted ATP-grasp superfamily ATP-dependent carboligase
MSGVILTSGRFWRTLAAVKCLGKHNIKAAVGEIKNSEYPFPPAFYSRYCCRHFYYPPFETQPEDFINTICAFANKNKDFDVLLPVNLESYIIAKYIDNIKSLSPHLKIPLHSYEYLSLANDKKIISQLATKLNIPIPQTFYPCSSEDVEKVSERTKYPAVIKIRTGSANQGMTYIYSPQKMVPAYEATVKKYSLSVDNLPIIQEYIPGTDYVAAAVFNHGQLKAKIAIKAIRNSPPSGGLLISRISVLHEPMLNYLTTLASAMHWHGLISADFRVDERDDIPKLLEVNPRFWYSLYQAIASGLEIPYLLYRIAADGDVPSVESYMPGIRTGFILSDTLNILSKLPKPGNRLETLKEFLEFKTRKFEDVSFSDPVPILATALDSVLTSAKKRLARYLSRKGQSKLNGQ